MESTHTHTHAHTYSTALGTLATCCADTTYLNAQIPLPLSTLHISMFVYCLCHRVLFFFFPFAVCFRSSFTMGCRSSIRSWCLLLSSRNRKQRRDGRTEEEEGLGVWRGAKQGKKEKPKREKTKNLPVAAESHWSQCK